MKPFWQRSAKEPPTEAQAARSAGVTVPPYATEFMAAFDRMERYRLKVPFRLLVEKNCLDMQKALPVLLAYFLAYEPEELVGKTLAINTDLVSILWEKLGVPFYLTTGWMEKEGRAIFRHDDTRIEMFLREGLAAWQREGVPFHIWLTSPSLEILDLTYAMNNGWAKTAKQCAELVIYQPLEASNPSRIYHPMLVGDDFFVKTGVIADVYEPPPPR